MRRRSPDTPTDAFSHGDIGDMSKEELQDFALTILRGFNTSSARAAKYKRFYKNHQGQSSRPPGKDGRREAKPRGPPKDPMTVKCFGCFKMGHYKVKCPSILEKEREEIRAMRENGRRALLAEETTPVDGINHDEDEFTEDEDEGKPLPLDMGMLVPRPPLANR